MKNIRKILTLIIILTISVSLYVILPEGKVMGFTGPFHFPSIWQGYITLLVDKDISEEAILETLYAAGYKQVVSYQNETITVFSYTNEQKEKVIPLKEVEHYFEPEDPLHDPYIKNVCGYFRGALNGKSAHVLYIKSDQARHIHISDYYNLYFTLSSALPQSLIEKQYWYLPDIITMQPLAALFLVLVLTILLLLYAKNVRYVLLIALIPSLLFLLKSSIYSISLFFIFTFLWTDYINSFINRSKEKLSKKKYLNQGVKQYLLHDKEFRIYLLTGFIIFIVFILLSIYLNTILVIHSTFIVIPFFIVTCTVIGYFVIKNKNIQHPLFVFKPIADENKKNVPSKKIILVLFSLVIIFAPLGLLFFGQELSFPQPVEITSTANPSLNSRDDVKRELNLHSQDEYLDMQEIDCNFSWNHLKRLSQVNRGELPDIIDYIKHRAFQAGYFYGYHYQFPVIGETIYLNQYILSNNSISTGKEVVKIFTDEWYDDIIAEKSGVVDLLLQQGYPVGGSNRSINKREVVNSIYKNHLIISLLLFISLLLPQLKNLQLRFVIRNIVQRRKQQAT